MCLAEIVCDRVVEYVLRKLRFVPVLPARALASDPDLPDSATADCRPGVGVDDPYLDPVQWLTAADQFQLLVWGRVFAGHDNGTRVK